MLDVARKLNISLDPKEIGRTHRVGKQTPGKPRAIIAKFVSYNSRNKVYQARKSSPNGVFISEDLTKRRSNIMFHARGLKRDKKIHSCWTKDGRMFVRESNPWGPDRDNGRVVQIYDIEDLNVYRR